MDNFSPIMFFIVTLTLEKIMTFSGEKGLMYADVICMETITKIKGTYIAIRFLLYFT